MDFANTTKMRLSRAQSGADTSTDREQYTQDLLEQLIRSGTRDRTFDQALGKSSYSEKILEFRGGGILGRRESGGSPRPINGSSFGSFRGKR